ncbi:MAG: oligosaccharide flippase family protein, partial [Pseudomonadota bacterium]|nr:oligosaccharide flippase family protein [Pseudomonadota bacterium]
MQTLTISARLRALLGGQSTLRQHLARAAAGSAILALSSKLLMLLTSVFLARWMGAEGYGIYATAMALVLLLSVPSGLGLPMLMIRYLASYGVHQQWPLMRGLLIRANQAVLAISLLTVGVAGIAIWVLADQMGD